ncbi:MAG TPA: NADH-quinone oxidoreductase subunit NuoN, partial [Roseateles sp.]|nr:NADH-quinone oxidoreductase subunit NuoN [Roseateles sp.]
MNTMNWLAVYPEIILLVMACVVALVDLFVTDPERRPTYWLTQLSVAVVGAMHLSYFNDGQTEIAMQGMVVSDPMGHLLGFFSCIATIVTLVYARPYAAQRDILKGELFTLSLFSLLGIMVMLQANNFLVIYLGLELMTLSLYALVALRRDHAVSTEAAMKYFVLGALASGFLLYGLSMMYGATGSLSIPRVFEVIATGAVNKSVLVFGVVFVVAGLAFKLGAAPFHMWVPDVYHGAPTAVTLLIGAAPKLASFAITIRLLVEGMLGLAVDWQQMLLVLALVSMIVGNLAAIAQSNLKRMLAYSTIAQMGFMLLGMASGVVGDSKDLTANAYSSSLFYAVTYVLTTLGSFGIILLLSRHGHEAEEIKDLAGLAKRSPWYALVMTIFMFSLAGIPPTAGFYAKLAVLQAVVATNVPFYIGLAVV